MFEGYRFKLLNPTTKLTLSIENHNGKVVDEDYNHVIAEDIDFDEYNDVINKMIPITSSDWIYDSLSSQKLMNTKKYHPDVRHFMKGVYICVGDDISNNDKEIIYGGVKAFGGMYFDELTRLTTHLVTLAMDNDKAIVASSSDIDIKVVRPEWIHDCFRLGKRLNESNYLIEDSNENSIVSDDYDKLPSIYDSEVLKGKKIHISTDYQLSRTFKDSITALVTANGGELSKLNQANVYIGKFRLGDFFQALESGITIGNLPWLYSVITHGWSLPVNLLHFPIPPSPLSSFRDLKICVSGYEGDARYYISRLIVLLGATYTKTLSKDNHILICLKPLGKKYEAAKTWKKDDVPIIKVVNHLWLEESYSNWEKMGFEKKFEDLSGMERLIGATKLNLDILRSIVDDSVDDELLYEGAEPEEMEESETQDVEVQKEGSEEVEEGEEVEVEEGEGGGKEFEGEEVEEADEVEEPKVEQMSEQKQTKPQTQESVATESQSIQPSTPTPQQLPQLSQPSQSRSKRKAASKAALKLHDNMEDLNNYQQMSKSNRKMKDYMETLDKENVHKRAKTASPKNSPPNSQETHQNTPLKASVKSQEDKIIAIITGWDELTKEMTNKLKGQGIVITNDYRKVNTLIAPKILRTEKFLVSLSHVKRILHPLFLLDRSKGLIKPPQEYSLEKIIGEDTISKELGLTGNIVSEILRKQAPIFKSYRLNLSSNLNGGFDVLSKILRSHGISGENLKEVNFKTKVDLFLAKDETIVVVNPKKDSKLIKNAKDCVVIDWDWCVKSIFSMEVQPFEGFIVTSP